jgi:hypothetical protein
MIVLYLICNCLKSISSGDDVTRIMNRKKKKKTLEIKYKNKLAIIGIVSHN